MSFIIIKIIDQVLFYLTHISNFKVGIVPINTLITDLGSETYL